MFAFRDPSSVSQEFPLVVHFQGSGELPWLVRLHSRCLYGEVFGSLDCDCDAQLELACTAMSNVGGFLVYLEQEGRGAGLFMKARGYELAQKHDLNTVEAYQALGLEPDSRVYHGAATVLRALGVDSVRLLTNNPRKLEALVAEGFSVVREPIYTKPTLENQAYLDTKRDQLGHLFPVEPETK